MEITLLPATSLKISTRGGQRGRGGRSLRSSGLANGQTPTPNTGLFKVLLRKPIGFPWYIPVCKAVDLHTLQKAGIGV